MNETIVRAIVLLMVFVLAGFLISRATKGLIRLVVVGVLTMLFLIAARSMYNQIRESMAANAIPQTPPPQINISPTAAANPTASPTIVAAPTTPSTTAPTIAASSDTAATDTTSSDTASFARTGLKNIPIYASPYVASVNGRTPAQPSSPQQPDYQPDYRPPASQQPANPRPATQQPATQQPIPAGW